MMQLDQLNRHHKLVLAVLVFMVFPTLIAVMVSTGGDVPDNISTSTSNSGGHKPSRQRHPGFGQGPEYPFAVIADKDKASRVGDAGHKATFWASVLKEGVLVRDQATGRYTVRWTREETLRTQLNHAGRGMELSELIWYDGRLLSCDDRTGIVYEISNGIGIPRSILTDGNGDVDRPFKCEWMTIKDDLLYVGGMGKPFVNTATQQARDDPMWVKTLDATGTLRHVSWVQQYAALMYAAKVASPGLPLEQQGYLLHESAGWNAARNEWWFLPRRVSSDPYDPEQDETRGNNLVLVANAEFTAIRSLRVGELLPTHGFSSFKWVPGRPSDIIAVKTEEVGDSAQSWLMVFNADSGAVLMDETPIDLVKFEGVEFL